MFAAHQETMATAASTPSKIPLHRSRIPVSSSPSSSSSSSSLVQKGGGSPQSRIPKAVSPQRDNRAAHQEVEGRSRKGEANFARRISPPSSESAASRNDAVDLDAELTAKVRQHQQQQQQ